MTQQDIDKKLTSTKKGNKVYFFVIAILALLATNVYFYIKFKSSGEKLYSLTLQRENLHTDIDRIEAELDNMRGQDTHFAMQFVEIENQARTTIENLRSNLGDSDVSEEVLSNSKKQISILKDQVSLLKEEMISLRLKNEMLAQQNELSSDDLEETADKLVELQRKEKRNNTTINKASSIKVSNVHINGVEEKKNGEFDVSLRARKVDKLQIHFTIADNPIAKIGKQDIYVRIINPNGNLIAKPEDLFYVHGEKLQYTFKQTVQFTNNGEEYQFLWSDASQPFKKGAYTILLYADNAIMGRSSIVLK